ncbi:MAG TPA: C40 family peptidase [candidate division Zixibacteria bacterium]|nr:C40 family peptidase [candidate division Zixibacteria bacterium]
MRYCYVTNNLVDLWSAPKFECERVSQLFWGEPVELMQSEEGFAQVRQPDGYEGWVDSRFLAPMTSDDYHAAIGNSNAVVRINTADIFANTRGQIIPPFFLYFGTRLKTEPLKSAFVKVRMPDSSHFYIKKTTIRPLDFEIPVPVNGMSVIAEARRFLGVPYLWGGVSPAGFDCSGFVRTVYSSLGIYLPRDTKDQIKAGSRIELDKLKAGDLLFFKRHVAIALDEKNFIHSSRGGGGVRINSLDLNDPSCRIDLKDTFDQARRIL